MALNAKRIGFALTGSHCTYQEIWPQVQKLKEAGADIYPIASPAVAETDTRFGAGQRSLPISPNWPVGRSSPPLWKRNPWVRRPSWMPW